MKRILLLVVVVVLLAGAAFLFLGRRGASEGAQLVPADTVLYVTLPDVKRTIDRWPKTALAQIGAEPAVADFFAKPASQLAMGGGLEAADLLLRVKPGRLFLALTKVNAAGGEAVIGFQFFGGSKDLDEAMDRLYREFGKHFPNATRTTTDYHGDAITAYSAAAPVFYSAAHGSWASSRTPSPRSSRRSTAPPARPFAGAHGKQGVQNGARARLARSRFPVVWPHRAGF